MRHTQYSANNEELYPWLPTQVNSTIAVHVILCSTYPVAVRHTQLLYSANSEELYAWLPTQVNSTIAVHTNSQSIIKKTLCNGYMSFAIGIPEWYNVKELADIYNYQGITMNLFM